MTVVGEAVGAPAWRPATTDAFRLAESPVWDAVRERVLWVDLYDGRVLAGPLDAAGGIRADEVLALDGPASAVAVAADGALLVAGRDRLHAFDTVGARRDGAPLTASPAQQLNDGKPDPAGRFIVGTLGGPVDAPPSDRLVRVETDGSIAVLDADLSLSNGLAWSVDGSRLYSVDTTTRRIHVRDYDPATGAHGPRSVLTTLRTGLPDGIAVDAEDHLLVAVWGTGEVLRLSPAGRIVERVVLPAPHVTSVAFAGPGLGTLVVTTAHDELDAGWRSRCPDSGRLFTVRTAVPGAPVAAWNGVLA